MADLRNPSNRQIFYLFLGFLVLFVIVFSLGVIVGKELNSATRPFVVKQEPVDLFGEQKSAENYVETERSDGIGEDQEFESTTIIPGNEYPELEAPAKNEPVEEQKQVAIDESSQVVTNYKKDTQPQKPENEIEVEKETASQDNASKSSSEILEEDTIPTKVKEKEVRKERELTKQEILEDLAAKKDKKEVASLPAADSKGNYTVQIGSFKDEQGAQALSRKLKSKGYPAFVKSVDIAGQGSWYRVRVGTFNSKEKARLYGDDLRKDPDVKLVFVTLNN